MMSEDSVNHPPYYGQHPSGIECIKITEIKGKNYPCKPDIFIGTYEFVGE